MPPITEFMQRHYRHFNAAAMLDAPRGYIELLKKGGKMFVTIAGAMANSKLETRNCF
ncbi:MAG TPA: hypothetical protein VK699_02565 [Terriglobales bacterium]|jgi:deoxyhypusine synthase|nr:hypothetical protein [Terriglobales bacterium]